MIASSIAFSTDGKNGLRLVAATCADRCRPFMQWSKTCSPLQMAWRVLWVRHPEHDPGKQKPCWGKLGPNLCGAHPGSGPRGKTHRARSSPATGVIVRRILPKRTEINATYSSRQSGKSIFEERRVAAIVMWFLPATHFGSFGITSRRLV